MTAQTGSWIFATSSPRKFAVPTRWTSRPGLMETNVAVDCDPLRSPCSVCMRAKHTAGPGSLRRARVRVARSA